MADEPTGEDDVLELTDAVDPPDQEGTEDETEGESEEIAFSIGSEAAPASDDAAPEWARNLRKQFRDVVRERDELKKQIEAPKAIEVGPKPTLAEFEYDEDRYDEALDAWKARKSQAEKAQTEAEQAKVREAEKYQDRLKSYGEQKDSLGIKDFTDLESEVLAALNETQRGLLIRAAKQSALTVAALGRMPSKLREVAAITDPLEFTFTLGQLDRDIKMERRKVGTVPDTEVRGSASLGGSSDKTLQRLEKEAARTGDRTQLIAYRKKLNARAKG